MGVLEEEREKKGRKNNWRNNGWKLLKFDEDTNIYNLVVGR